jgi:hypothetical protein
MPEKMRYFWGLAGLCLALVPGSLSAAPVTETLVPEAPYTYGQIQSLWEQLYQNGGGVSLVDYDADGDLDMMVLDGNAGSASASDFAQLYRNGDSSGGPAGTFTKVDSPFPLPFGPIFVGTGTEYADWADFDLDGDPDLVLTFRTFDLANYAVLLRNEAIQGSPGSFTFLNFWQTADITKNFWGNFNDGNYPDLFIGGVLWSNNVGTGQFIETSITINKSYIGANGTLRVIDVDKDGYDDVIQSYDRFRLLINELDTVAAFVVDSDLLQLSYVPSGTINDTWGDVDGDGDMDVIWCPSNSKTIAFYRNGDAFGGNSGKFADASLFLGATTINNINTHPVLIDYDADEDLDLVLPFGVKLFAGGIFGEQQSLPQFNYNPGVPVIRGDLNGDGYDDFGIGQRWYANIPQFSVTASYDDAVLTNEPVRIKFSVSPTEERPGREDVAYSLTMTGMRIQDGLIGSSYGIVGTELTATIGSSLVGTFEPRFIITTDDYARADIFTPFTTRSPDASSFIQRHYSQSYVPGISQTVVLLANPSSGSSYSIAERIPFGWTVENFSTGGVYLQGQNTLNFGPYFDTNPRTLVYTLRPSEEATGYFMISGTGSVDGSRSVVRPFGNWSGASEYYIFYEAIAHPADVNPRDQVLANPINQDFVTRAAYIWRNGWQYFYDLYKGYDENASPVWWDVYSLPDTSGEGTQPVYFDFSGEQPTGTFTAVSAFSTNELTVSPFEVSISTSLSGSLTNHAIVEKLPPGWSASNINNGGSYNSFNNTISWGPFFDSSPRTLIYTAIPASGLLGHAAFIGALSVDGGSVPVSGQRELGSWTPEQLSLASPSARYGGEFTLTSVDVTAQQGVRWTAFSNDPWIQVLAESTEGQGSGKVFFSLSKNETGATRQGQINIGGRLFTVDQDPFVSGVALIPNQWNLTEIGYVYGYTENWGYSIFMGFVYLEAYPWIYQSNFSWLYKLGSSPLDGGGTSFWFYNSELGNIYVADNEGGWFRSQNTGWAWNNFLNPL